MPLENELSSLISGLLLPPGVNLVLFLTALLIYKRLKWLSLGIFIFSTSLLLILSLPRTTAALNHHLDIYPVLNAEELTTATPDTAIVLLGYGDSRTAPELGFIDTIGPMTLERVRYAAYLHKQLELPLLVSGGRKTGQASPESVLANQVLIDDFDAAPKWLESRSSTIQEQVVHSVEILSKHNVKTVFIVTHAVHMHLAVTEFEKFQLEIIPAPIPRTHHHQTTTGIALWLPSSRALQNSNIAVTQFIYRLWYWLQHDAESKK